MPNPNENCLAGMRCPKCGNCEQFNIIGLVTFEVTDEGSEAVGDHEWTDESWCTCPECNFSGYVKDFDDPECKEDKA